GVNRADVALIKGEADRHFIQQVRAEIHGVVKGKGVVFEQILIGLTERTVSAPWVYEVHRSGEVGDRKIVGNSPDAKVVIHASVVLTPMQNHRTGKRKVSQGSDRCACAGGN